jgi:hypothetical protein
MFILASLLITLAALLLFEIGIGIICAAIAVLGWPLIIVIIIALMAAC